MGERALWLGRLGLTPSFCLYRSKRAPAGIFAAPTRSLMPLPCKSRLSQYLPNCFITLAHLIHFAFKSSHCPLALSHFELYVCVSSTKNSSTLRTRRLCSFVATLWDITSALMSSSYEKRCTCKEAGNKLHVVWQVVLFAILEGPSRRASSPVYLFSTLLSVTVMETHQRIGDRGTPV